MSTSFYYGTDHPLAPVACALGLTFLFVGLGIELKFIYSFWNYGKNIPLLKKRYFHVSIIVSIGFVLATFGISLMATYQSEILEINGFRWGSYTFLVFILGMQISIYGCAFRFWMIYFDTHVCEIAESQNWKTLINPKLEIKKGDRWFIEHKKDWGNYHFTQKRFIIIGVVTGIFEGFMFLVYARWAPVIVMPITIRCFQFLLPLSIMIYCYKNAIYIVDDLKVLQEIKYIVNCLLFTISFMGILLIIYIFFVLFNVDTKYTPIIYSIISLFSSFMLILCVYYTCYWVLNELKKIEFSKYRQEKMTQIVQENESIISSSTTQPASPKPMSNKAKSETIDSNNESDVNNWGNMTNTLSAGSMAIVAFHSLHNILSEKDIRINNVLSNAQCFHYLMQHLSHEFSIECLLSYTEFTYFMLKLDKIWQFNANTDTHLKKYHNLLILPRNKEKEKDKDNKDKDKDNNDKSFKSRMRKVTSSAVGGNKNKSNIKFNTTIKLQDESSMAGSQTATSIITNNNNNNPDDDSKDIIEPTDSNIDSNVSNADNGDATATAYNSFTRDDIDTSVIPESYIVDIEHTNEKLNNIANNDEKVAIFRQIAYNLYSKYITIDAEYEINISSRLRSDFAKKMSNKDLFIQTGRSPIISKNGKNGKNNNNNNSSNNYSRKTRNNEKNSDLTSDDIDDFDNDIPTLTQFKGGDIVVVSEETENSTETDDMKTDAEYVSMEKRKQKIRVKEMKQIYCLFGKCNREMIKLMSYSLSRMKSKEDMWPKIKHCLLDDQPK